MVDSASGEFSRLSVREYLDAVGPLRSACRRGLLSYMALNPGSEKVIRYPRLQLCIEAMAANTQHHSPNGR